MNRNDLANIYSTLNGLTGVYPVKFAYAISRNKKIILEELKMVEEHKPKIDEAYEKERVEMLVKNAVKNEDGSIDWENVQTQTPKIKDMEQLNSDFEELKERYKNVIEKYEQESTEYSNFMEEEVDIDIYKIKIENFPETINQKTMDSLCDIIITD